MSEVKEADAGRRLSGSAVDRIQALVQDQPWLFRLPRGFAREFALRRQQQFARLAVIGTPLLLLMFFAVSLTGYLFFSFEIDGVDREIWWLLTGVDGFLVFLGLSLARIPRFLPYFQGWVGTLGGLVLANKLLLALLVVSPRLSQHETYVVMLVITVVMLALRLNILVSLGACVAGAVGAYALARLLDQRPDLPQMAFYCMGSLVVNGFVAALLERQEKLNFLQAVLLEHEARERGLLNAQLARIARQDPLSGLSNRRHFDEQLIEEWERGRREKQTLALLFIDVDHFKAYNDRYGHPAGDACLSQIGTVLGAALLRPADMAARYGGEEFVLLLPGTDLAGAKLVAERVLAAVDALGIPHLGSGVAPHVTVSIGLASVRPDQWPLAKTLVDTADAALYEAKRHGRHHVVERQPLGLPV